FRWGARIIGIGLLIATVLGFARAVLTTLLLDAILSGLATLLCACVGLIWLIHGDMDGILVGVFAFVNGSAATNSWRHWQLARAVASSESEP
ncbi:MAG: hypothetical protein JXO22_07045, partial [Phycisphaerae bacterium]|nr:hypothetical protein [Phycisphaerae bacterium]